MEQVKEGYLIDCISGQTLKATPEEVQAVQPFAKKLMEDYGYPVAHIQPVSRNRYSGKANRKIALPKREIIWPITTRVKSRLKSFVCIKYLHYLTIKPTVGLIYS